MANLSSFFGGGGGAASLPHFGFTSSTTWTVALDGQVAVHVIGAGGGGGAGVVNSRAASPGGGAGGYSRKVIDVTSGQSYTITIGAGGTGGLANNAAGTNGSASSFVGNSINMVGNGGSGGPLVSTAATHSGGAGGTASGGDVNVTGGAGGGVVGSNSGGASNGGGAVGIFGTGYTPGNISASGNSGFCTGGGAGIGGAHGSFTNPTASQTVVLFGGGAGGPSTVPTLESSIPIQDNIPGPGLKFMPSYAAGFFNFLKEDFGGGALFITYPVTVTDAVTAFAGIGGGGSAPASLIQNYNYIENTNVPLTFATLFKRGGMFGGGAGSCAESRPGGSGGLGGGGGGGPHQTSRAGNGGNGIIFVEYLSLA
jgi:hypothetical protein